jgi:hypothetical protein
MYAQPAKIEIALQPQEPFSHHILGSVYPHGFLGIRGIIADHYDPSGCF